MVKSDSPNFQPPTRLVGVKTDYAIFYKSPTRRLSELLQAMYALSGCRK